MPNRSQARAAKRESRRLARDPHRRRKYLTHVRSNPSVIRGAVATLEALLEHSDDLAKPIWPSQERLAKLAHVSVRTVQRHLQELRDAGYLLVYVRPSLPSSGVVERSEGCANCDFTGWMLDPGAEATRCLCS